MQIMLALLLFVGIIIMISLLFIGYFLHANSQRTMEISNIISTKENDLLELYYSLEQMMAELESFTENAKSDIGSERDQIKAWFDEIKAPFRTDNERKSNHIDNPTQSSKDEGWGVQQAKLMEKYQKGFDHKGSKIWAFHRKGLTVSDIAKEMKIGQGEVQLILNLKKTI